MKVTVIVPTYNCEKYVLESLQSIAMQTYRDLKVIVVDNESTDGTVDIVKKECERNGWQFDSVPNLYKYSWYEPTRHAMDIMDKDTGWFTIIAADDYIEPNYIENCVNLVSRMKKMGLEPEAVQTPFKGFGARDGLVRQAYPLEPTAYFAALKKSCVVNTPTVFWRADLVGRGLMKSHPEKFGGAEDYWMYLNQANKGVLIYPYPNWIGYNYRWNQDQATWGMIKNMPHVDKMIKDEWNDNN